LASTKPVEEAAEGGSRPSFRRDIQGLRALAVLLVIANHAGVPGMAGGYIGVDMFFVISGYVITQLLLRETTKGVGLGLLDFYSRRIRRIVPAASLTLVGTITVAAIVLGRHLNPNLPGDVRWASLFAANFRLISTGSNYFVPGIFPSLITQFWSLAVEEQFYLCFPLLVFVTAAVVRRDRHLQVLRSALVLLIAASAAWSIHLSATDPTPAYYSPFTRFWELGLGCLLATATVGRPSRTLRASRLAAFIGVALLLVALVTLGPTSTYPGSAAWLPCGAGVLLIWAGAGTEPTSITRFLERRTLVYLGDLSYSLYLFHFVWLKLPEQLAAPLGGWGWRTVELLGTLVTSVASYHLIENPIRHSRRLAADRVAVGLLLLVCIAASWTATIIVVHASGIG
jgi:peptidoglycan/LPS O-acetylase OafA/YrhL